MPDSAQSVYFVNADGDPVRLVIKGRASYTNCAPAQTFLERVTGEGASSLLVDFTDCTGMDSTFLGLLAGAALRIKGRKPSPGMMTLTGLSPRNLELVRNLGLHRLMTVDGAAVAPAPDAAGLAPESPGRGAASHDTILRAHEDLMRIDPANDAKFRDVVTFLKREAPPKP